MAVVRSKKIQRLIDQGLFERLPPTFTSFFFQRIREWDLLFPAERGYFERLFGLLDRAPVVEVERLFAPLRKIEQMMRVNPKTWKSREFTLEHVDFLNRSQHYGKWRREIRRIFSLIDPMLEEEIQRTGRRRLVVVIAPEALPTGPDRMWLRLRDHGRLVAVENDSPDELVSLVLTGSARGQSAPSLLGHYQESEEGGAYDVWAVESGRGLDPFSTHEVVRLSYSGLQSYRERLMAEVKKVLGKSDIRGPRELGARLKGLKVSTGVERLDQEPVLAEFVRSVMLSGNGTLLINNTFVEWATAQAARRARPHLAVVAFGIRNKVKPFSSLLLYTDQDKANVIPSQQDVLGSYVDLEVFYQYVWQGFEKYAEYRNKTAYLFLGAYLDQMFVIAPPEFPAFSTSGALPPARLHAECKEWLAS